MIFDLIFHFYRLLFEIPQWIVDFFTPWTEGIIGPIVSLTDTIMGYLETITGSLTGLEAIFPVQFMLTCALVVFGIEVLVLNSTLLMWSIKGVAFLKKLFMW